jgi:hypothetical protein
VDGVGGPVEVVGAASGYWWPRVSITFVGLALVLTLAAMRLVVPAGMRGRPWRRPRRAAVLVGAGADPAGGVIIDDLEVDER